MTMYRKIGKRERDLKTTETTRWKSREEEEKGTADENSDNLLEKTDGRVISGGTRL